MPAASPPRIWIICSRRIEPTGFVAALRERRWWQSAKTGGHRPELQAGCFWSFGLSFQTHGHRLRPHIPAIQPCAGMIYPYAGVVPAHAGTLAGCVGATPAYAGTLAGCAGMLAGYPGIVPACAGILAGYAGTVPMCAGIVAGCAGLIPACGWKLRRCLRNVRGRRILAKTGRKQRKTGLPTPGPRELMNWAQVARLGAGSGHGSRPNIELDLGRRWTNADDMKWKAIRLLSLTLKSMKQDRLNAGPSTHC